MNVLYRHPLAELRARMGVSATRYLQLVDSAHRALGHGAMATRREKVTRWEAGSCAPELTAQLAMAELHGVPLEAVHELGWPDWLLLALPGEEILAAPWTPAGTVASMTASARGGSVDRRGFLIATGTTLATITGDWTNSVGSASAVSTTGRRRLTPGMIDHLERRLDGLRHLDDVLGGKDIRHTAMAEFELLAKLAGQTVYDSATGTRLFQAICEAGRICGWLHFDQGLHASAQKFYITALRASATAGDPVVGANVLAFMTIQTYSVGNPSGRGQPLTNRPGPDPPQSHTSRSGDLARPYRTRMVQDRKRPLRLRPRTQRSPRRLGSRPTR
jgi:hypothetical protein